MMIRHRRWLRTAFVAAPATFLIACGGSSNPTGTTAPIIPPTTASSAVAATPTTASVVVSATTGSAVSGSATTSTRPAGTTASSVVVGTTIISNATTGSATRPAGTTIPGSVVSGSMASGTRPAGSVTTGSAISGTRPAGTTTAAVQTTTFRDPKGRFTFNRPTAWQETSGSDASIVVSYLSTAPQGSFNLITQDVPANLNLDQEVQTSLDALKMQIPGYMAGPMGVQNGMIDGEPARAFDYFGTLAGTRVYFQQVFVAHKGTVYIFTAVNPATGGTASPDAWTTQLGIVEQSFHFLQ